MMADMIQDRPDWPLRPWLLAALGVVAGLVLYTIIGDYWIFSSVTLSVWQITLASFVATFALLTAFTLERDRWHWSLIFSGATAAIIALIFYWNGGANDWGQAEGWRLACGLLSVAIAAPLFQAARDQGARRFPYAEVHGHAWTNVVLWCAAWAFVGIVFALSALLAELFTLIKITALQDLLKKPWFIFILMGAAYGGAIGVFREQDKIVRLLQRVVVGILSVLAPIWGVGLALFLLSLPFTGLDALWEATTATTPILLSCIIGALILINAVIDNGVDEESRSKPLRYGAMILAVVILPLALIAAISTARRIEQYGYTPDRLWALVFVVIACAYGAAYLVALIRGRMAWGSYLRPTNLKLAFGLCGLALFLAFPIVNFNAISTNSQLARLQNGKVSPEQFDWRALAFDFGQPGKDAVKNLAKSANAKIKVKAEEALKVKSKWDLDVPSVPRKISDDVVRRIKIVPASVALPEGLLESFRHSLDGENQEARFVIYYRAGDKNAVMVTKNCPQCDVVTSVSYLDTDGTWRQQNRAPIAVQEKDAETIKRENLATDKALDSGKVEIRDVTRRQVFVDGKPVGDDFE